MRKITLTKTFYEPVTEVECNSISCLDCIFNIEPQMAEVWCKVAGWTENIQVVEQKVEHI